MHLIQLDRLSNLCLSLCPPLFLLPRIMAPWAGVRVINSVQRLVPVTKWFPNFIKPQHPTLTFFLSLQKLMQKTLCIDSTAISRLTKCPKTLVYVKITAPSTGCKNYEFCYDRARKVHREKRSSETVKEMRFISRAMATSNNESLLLQNCNLIRDFDMGFF